jgi:dihydroorotate dehydrogenase (fumarate)
MANLETIYAGLKLKNPLIIGSSSLTGNTINLKKFEKSGAAAVVLKSIFEEEILNEYEDILKDADSKGEKDHNLDYFDFKIKEDNLTDYIALIESAKSELNIPVIASVNCISSHEWLYFLKKIETAGADAIELNIFYFPADFKKSSKKIEKKYLKIIRKAKASVNIPIIVKMSQYFTNLGDMILKVSDTGVDGIALFNRFYKPDIDLKKKEITTADIFSSPHEYVIPLQWVALMKDRFNTSLAASTGIHNGEAFVKLLLAGANVNYIVSALFKNGAEVIGEILSYLESYLEQNNHTSVNEIIGSLSQGNINNPKHYERAQFMKYFSDRKDVI